MSTPLSIVDTSVPPTWDSPPKWVIQQVAAGDACYHLVVYNESGLGMIITFDGPGGTGDVLPANYVRTFEVPAGTTKAMLQQYMALAGSPSNLVVPTLYAPNEQPPGGWPEGPLARLVSVGNQVSTTGTASVVQDNQPAPNEVIEARPNGAATSKLVWNNDGSGIFGGGNVEVDANGNWTMPAGSVPPGALAAGALPAGVTLPAGQITGSIQAGSLGGVLIGNDNGVSPAQQPTLRTNTTSGHTYDMYAQTYDGAATHRVLVVDHAGLRYSDPAGMAAGGLPAGVALGGDPATAGFNPDRIGVTLGGTGYSGGDAATGFIWNAAARHDFSQNAYWDGTNWRHVTAATSYLLTVASGVMTLNISTDAPAAGGIITWSPAGDYAADTSGGLNLRTNGTTWLHGDTSGFRGQQAGSPIKQWNYATTTTSSGTTTITHGVGTTPKVVLICPIQAGTSYTISISAIGATTFAVLIGAGISLNVNWWAFA